MSLWDFKDRRFREARKINLLLTGVGVISCAGVIWLLFSYDRLPTAAKAPVLPAIVPAAPTPKPEEVRRAEFQRLQTDLDQAVRLRNWGETENLARKVIERDPENAAAWAHLGRVQERKGDPVQALAAYDRAIQAAGEVPIYFYLRARLHRKSGSSEAALRDIQMAARLDPHSILITNTQMIYQIQGGEAETVRAAVINYENAGIQANANQWLLGAAALALNDGEMEKAKARFRSFRNTASPGIFEVLAGEPFFNPFRSNAMFKPYLLEYPGTSNDDNPLR